MNKFFLISILFAATCFFTACEEEPGEDPIPKTEAIEVFPNVGGPTQPNIAFIDLANASNNVAIDKSKYDLAFSTGTDFKCYLNGSVGMLAKNSGKTTFANVGPSDSTDLAGQLDLDAIFSTIVSGQMPAWLPGAVSWADDRAADPEIRAIADINSDASQNEVYIINRGRDADGNSLGWKKVKVNLNQDNYEVIVADIDGSNEMTHSISKDENYTNVYLDFELGTVQMAPQNWQLAFSTHTSTTSFGGAPIPYFFKDIVLLNGDQAEATMIIDSSQTITEAFNQYTLTNAQGLQLSSNHFSIGSTWRDLGTRPGQVSGVKTDRFYVIKLNDGKYYKLLFSALINSSGERGYPEFIYQELI